MKKIFILALTVIICTGCVRIDKEENKDIVINEIISETSHPNEASIGYEYYLPLGVEKVYDKDYNQKFKVNNSYIYLYVDVVSYYYQNKINFNEENRYDNYYYYKITNGEKNGYIKISQQGNDSYFIKIIYNYAKIEAITDKENLNKVMADSMIIINNIRYNEKLIKKLLENNNYLGVEKEYKINKPEDAKSKFSEYLSEYVQEENKVSDLPEY